MSKNNYLQHWESTEILNLWSFDMKFRKELSADYIQINVKWQLLNIHFKIIVLHLTL